MSLEPSNFSEHRIQRGAGGIFALHYRGAGPTFVLMHGFPDNLHIWDDLVPLLVAAGRDVVAFDFLGFGASDKPPEASYSFEQQLGDLESVVNELGLEKIVPVAHDSSGMAALNYALGHPERVASVVMLNSAYSDDGDVLWPEMIALFAAPATRALALAIAQDPRQLGWLLAWQQGKFKDALPSTLQDHFSDFIGALIGENFTSRPGAGGAFVQLTAQFFEELRRNTRQLSRLKELDVPVKLIWGKYDPYLSVAMAERRRDHLRHATLDVISAGHWLQADEPSQVAAAMLG
jgi:haloalkane dehalogenase